jgi:GntR family transcriptional regulator
MDIRIDKDTHVPIHYQIRDQIMALIQAGQLKPGDQLPTMRALSIALAVNFNTVAHAYRELDAMGVIMTRRGEGTFVAPPSISEAERAAMRKQVLERLVRGLLDEAARLGYSTDEVQRVLAQQFAARAQEN